MIRSINMDLLLLYVREDGLFARFLPSGSGEALNVSEKATVTEDGLSDLLNGLMQSISKKAELLRRRVTVVFSLSKRVEVLRPCIAEHLRSFRFSDSVSELSRDELLYRAAELLSLDGQVGLLYCDTRETRLFTKVGEIPLSIGRTGGNGFYDWLLGFVEGEEDSFEYYVEQIDRLWELFRAYRCFPTRGKEKKGHGKRIFPQRSAYPLLHGHSAEGKGNPAPSDGAYSGEAQSEGSENRKQSPEDRVDYTTLTSSEKQRVDRKYPALYRKMRGKRGHSQSISMEKAAGRFAELFTGLCDAELSRLVLIGYYAEFPLTVDFLSTIPDDVVFVQESEQELLLDGMEEAVIDRISGARLLLHDIDGDAVTLWESCPEGADVCPEKRVSFRTTMRRGVSSEEWKRKIPQLPYTIELEEFRRDADGRYKRVRVTKRGDFREFCYKRQRDGSYRLRLPPKIEGMDSAFSTVLLGLCATPTGVYCRVLSEKKDEGSV